MFYCPLKGFQDIHASPYERCNMTHSFSFCSKTVSTPNPVSQRMRCVESRIQNTARVNLFKTSVTVFVRKLIFALAARNKKYPDCSHFIHIIRSMLWQNIYKTKTCLKFVSKKIKTATKRFRHIGMMFRVKKPSASRIMHNRYLIPISRILLVY